MSGDFNYLDNKTVLDVIKQAARRVHRKFDEQYSEVEDLIQEAHIAIATTANLLGAIESEDYGLLQFRLEQDLTDLVHKEVRRTSKNISFDALLEAQDDGEYLASSVIIETASNDYSRESVESLLPAVWDESFVYGLPQKDTAPDPDMPRGSSNKAESNNLAAYISDIKFAWARTPLTVKERRALILAYGFGWTQQEIAFNQECSRPAITLRINTAIGKIVARLNGGFYYDREVEAA